MCAIAQCSDHRFCLDCTREYVKTKINKPLKFMKCMKQECKNYYSEDVVLELLKNEPELVQVYRQNKKLKNNQLDPFKRECPRCLKQVTAPSLFEATITCECGYAICFKCGRPAHSNWAPCTKTADLLFQNWLSKRNDIKECPNCTILIDKRPGSAYVECIYCYYEFCWLCNKKYENNHF